MPQEIERRFSGSEYKDGSERSGRVTRVKSGGRPLRIGDKENQEAERG